jgi:E3 ubiquitin-protein ligase EDD1
MSDIMEGAKEKYIGSGKVISYVYGKTLIISVCPSQYFINVENLIYREQRTLNAEALLDLDIFNLSSSGNNSGKKKKPASQTDRRSDIDDEDDLEDNAPLFWQPGKRGYYSLRPGKGSPERLNAFRNVGR